MHQPARSTAHVARERRRGDGDSLSAAGARHPCHGGHCRSEEGQQRIHRRGAGELQRGGGGGPGHTPLHLRADASEGHHRRHRSIGGGREGECDGVGAGGGGAGEGGAEDGRGEGGGGDAGEGGGSAVAGGGVGGGDEVVGGGGGEGGEGEGGGVDEGGDGEGRLVGVGVGGGGRGGRDEVGGCGVNAAEREGHRSAILRRGCQA